MVHNHEEKRENNGDTTVTNDIVEWSKNYNIDDVGVVDDSIPEQNNDDEATVIDETVEKD